jgi:hypothetical protein
MAYNENPYERNIMPYDQRSLEAGINAGIVVGVFLSVSTASAIYLTIKAVKGTKELFHKD